MEATFGLCNTDGKACTVQGGMVELNVQLTFESASFLYMYSFHVVVFFVYRAQVMLLTITKIVYVDFNESLTPLEMYEGSKFQAGHQRLKI